MRFIKIIAGWSAVFLFTAVFVLFTVYFLLYDSLSDFNTDLQFAKRSVKLEFFNRGYIKEITREDVRYIYQKKCYRQCHGEAAMITAVLSPAGWFQVVERMRLKENVKIAGREVDVIIKYLESNYPTVTSPFSFEVRKKVHEAVWRNDIGQGDIYTDVVYATPEYLRSIGAEHLIDEYGLKNYHVFITSFSVHEGEVELFDLDKVSFMRTAVGETGTAPPWRLRFQTADKHHFEAIVRFKKRGSPPIVNSGMKKFELILKDIGGPDDRVFTWELPIVYPPEMLEELESRLE